MGLWRSLCPWATEVGREGTVDIKVIFCKNFGAVVNGDTWSIKDSSQHILWHRDAQIIACELDSRLFHINPRRAFEYLAT